MRPSRRCLALLWSWFLLGIATALWSPLMVGWLIATVILGCALLIDALWLWGKSSVSLTRNLPTRLALGVKQEVEITLHNGHPQSLEVEFFDGLPPTLTSTQLPWQGRLPARGHATLHYEITPLERGSHQFSPAHLLRKSLLGLWQRALRLGTTEEIKVYPNFEPIIRFNLLAMTNRIDQMGIISLNRPGVSKEFHQLRDYQEGDALSQIDWKATSRRASLISREYRQQRDQTIIFAVDCGRRMRVMDGDLPQFDHCLNAILLLAQMAMRQGDSVGVLGFGGGGRWLPPVKGSHMMPTLLNHLYDYQTSGEPSDFSEAVERLLVQQKRRALVVFLTNLRSEDTDHIIAPLAQLRKKHLVMLATLKEQTLEHVLTDPIQTLPQALRYGATHVYLDERATLLAHLQAQRIHVIDATTKELPIELVNRYLEIKKEGQL
jgi:uncharacterized protein (DUF58 family)